MAATDINSVPHHDHERRGILGRILDVFVKIAESNHHMRRIEYLNAMSDAELAQRGIRREEIVRHVFRDSMHV